MMGFFFLVVLLGLVAIVTGKSIISVVANVRGRKYDLKADTVGDFISQVEKLAGLTPGQQSVLFRGKLLGTNENLSDAGVSNGDVLNVLKGRKTKMPHKPSAFKAPAVQKSQQSESSANSMPMFPGFGMSPNMSPEQMQESMAKMEEMIDSGMLDQLLNDPEQLEAMRVQLINNLDKFEKMMPMPGFRTQLEEIVSSPEKWSETMMRTKQIFEKMKQQRRKNGGGMVNQSQKTYKHDQTSKMGEKVDEPKDDDTSED